MSQRIDLPSRRKSVTHKLKVNKSTIYLTVGFYDEARTLPGELFITIAGSGIQVRTLADALARMTSMALQHGAPLEDLMQQWLGIKGLLCGPVIGDHEFVRLADSGLDAIAKHMLARYCGWNELRLKAKE
jgi:hypothetical protein